MSSQMSPIILSTAYFPPINYFHFFTTEHPIYIECYEYYMRHSFRNRAMINGPNNNFLITVPIQGGNSSKTLVKDIRIANENWQRHHIKSIQSSYGSAPFFIYYFSDIRKLINKKHVFLMDLNNDILEYFLNEFKIEKKVKKTTLYKRSYIDEISNQRHKIKVKRLYKKYQQVFNQKFTANLSVIDLIFNLGPNASEYISES